METNSQDTKQVDLKEVFEQIKASSKQTFKDKDDNVYCSVYVSKLRSWALALQASSGDLQKFEVTRKALQEAKDQIHELTRASTAKDLKLQELKDLAANAEKAAKEQRSKHQKEIASKQQELKAAKERLDDANKSKVATAKALSDAQAKLKSPEAKFSPLEASKLQAEARELQSDLELANSAIATVRALQGDLNRTIDTLYKEAAAKDKDMEKAKAELSNFKKQLAAAQAQNVDDFDIDELDFAGLETSFGSRGVEKLRAVLDIPAWDTRGRIQKLTGFFHVMGSSISRSFFAMVGVLEKALDLVKNKTSSWSGVIFPWVNSLLKDILFFQLKPVKHYREELEAIVAAVKGKMPAASLSEKIQAGNEAVKDQRSWNERLKDGRQRVKGAMSDLDNATSRFFASCKSFVKSASKKTVNAFKTGAKKISRGGARFYEAVKHGFSIGVIFFKAAWSTAPDRPYDFSNDPRRFTHDYDLNTGMWVPRGPIKLFDAEKLD